MADISRIVDLYDLYKSYRRVARELKISRNTVKKYVLRVKEVQDGLANEILRKNRGIIQPSRVLTEPVRQNIHEHLESNLSRPKKQRITAKRIWELLTEQGHKISYSSVKNEVARWKRTNAPRRLHSTLVELGRNLISQSSSCPFRSIDLLAFIIDQHIWKLFRLTLTFSMRSAQFQSLFSMTEWLQYMILGKGSSMISF